MTEVNRKPLAYTRFWWYQLLLFLLSSLSLLLPLSSPFCSYCCYLCNCVGVLLVIIGVGVIVTAIFVSLSFLLFYSCCCCCFVFVFLLSFFLLRLLLSSLISLLLHILFYYYNYLAWLLL